MRRFLLPMVVLLMVITAGPLCAETVVGSARVLDGDTLDIGNTRIRLYGIDAPEQPQPYGIEATNTLAALTSDQLLSCEGTERDAYGRLIAVCHVGATELNSTLVRLGSAWAFVKYSSNYVDQQEIAQRSRVGIWRDPARQPQAPWEFRAQAGGNTPGQSLLSIPAPSDSHRVMTDAPRQPPQATLAPSGPHPAAPSNGFGCSGKRYCGQMTSCVEAKFYLTQCGLSRLDADRDGVPCESLCR